MAEVLLVEDEDITRRLLAVGLQGVGHEVRAAASAAEAHTVVERAGAPEVLLTDMFMPGGSGLALVAALRAEPACADLPVVFLSGRALPGDVDAGRALGGAYLTKPFSVQELTQAIDQALAAGDAALSRSVRARLEDLGGIDGGSRALFAELLTLFVEQAPAAMTDVERAVATGDPEALEVGTHRLGGAAANLGAAPLARSCSALEERARRGEVPVPASLTRAVRRDLAATCRVLTALAGTLLASPPVEDADPEA